MSGFRHARQNSGILRHSTQVVTDGDHLCQSFFEQQRGNPAAGREADLLGDMNSSPQSGNKFCSEKAARGLIIGRLRLEERLPHKSLIVHFYSLCL